MTFINRLILAGISVFCVFSAYVKTDEKPNLAAQLFKAVQENDMNKVRILLSDVAFVQQFQNK